MPVSVPGWYNEVTLPNVSDIHYRLIREVDEFSTIWKPISFGEESTKKVGKYGFKACPYFSFFHQVIILQKGMSLIGYAFLFSFRKADLYPFNTRNIHRFSSKSLLFLYFCVRMR